MGLTVALETEDCQRIKQVHDPANLLHRLLPANDDRSYQLLRFIDWYGDTVFNRLQMEVFIVEWERIRRLGHSPEEVGLLSSVEELAWQCKNEPHLYLRFHGD